MRRYLSIALGMNSDWGVLVSLIWINWTKSTKNVLHRVGGGIGRYLSIVLAPKEESLCQVFKKIILLRVGGGMGRYLLITLSGHCEKEFLICYWVSFCCIAIELLLVLPNWVRQKGSSLEGLFGVYWRRNICTSFLSYLSESYDVLR